MAHPSLPAILMGAFTAAPAAARRSVVTGLGLWLVMMVLQAYDSAGGRGAAAAAEFLSALCGSAGGILLALTGVLNASAEKNAGAHRTGLEGVDALALVRERRPDVVFLDVAMPEVDGFDVARHLADPRPPIVFQTAYVEYAVRAFEHEALDYVVKPVTRERLAQALDRVRRRTAGSERWKTPDLASFGAAIGHVATRPERLLVRPSASSKSVCAVHSRALVAPTSSRLRTLPASSRTVMDRPR